MTCISWPRCKCVTVPMVHLREYSSREKYFPVKQDLNFYHLRVILVLVQGHSTKLWHKLWRCPCYICELASSIILHCDFWIGKRVISLFKEHIDFSLIWRAVNVPHQVRDNECCRFTDVTGTPSQIVSQLCGMTHVQVHCTVHTCRPTLNYSATAQTMYSNAQYCTVQ